MDIGNIYPPALRHGDTVAIVSPAGKIEPCKVENAVLALQAEGWNVKIGRYALGDKDGFSGTPQQRLSDLVWAFSDPEVKAVICSRGGYGAVHLLQDLETSLTPLATPKWLVGFSDISALHSWINHRGLVSIHGPMSKDIAKGTKEISVERMFQILRGDKTEFIFPSSPFDRPGLATGPLVGGNFSVIADLFGTPYNVIEPGTILFIEDLSEPIYKIQRVLYQLRLNGVLSQLGGLIVGQFTNYTPGIGYETMEDMIYQMVEPYDYPVAMNLPCGHIDSNMPLILGAKITLRVTLAQNNSIVYW